MFQKAGAEGMKKNIYRVLSVVAVALCLWVIFGFSAQPAETSLSSSGGIIEAVAKFFNSDFESLTKEQQAEIVDYWQVFVRKTAHFCEYALLGFLSANALCTYRLNKALKALIPVGFCLVCAVCDEVQQSFIPGRAGCVADVLLDTLGGVAGTAAFMFVLWMIKRFIEKRRPQNDTTVEQ